jgi:hypothetical protein
MVLAIILLAILSSLYVAGGVLIAERSTGWASGIPALSGD